ncbi:MAG: hypothetical protein FD167_3415 [bacterium]|nr:MAG: hypothetical protein FD167_3415 [bacterium]
MSIKLKVFFAAVSLAIFAQSTMAQQPGLMVLTSDTTNSKLSDNKTSDTPNKASDNKSSEVKGESKPSSETEIMLKEVQDLHRTVKLLETRIKELESKLGNSTEKADNSTEKTVKEISSESTSAAVAVTTPEVLKPEDDKSSPADKILSFFERTEVSGFVDAYYGYNFNRPDVGTNVTAFDNQLRNFDTKHNQFSLNQAKLVLSNVPSEDHRLGFRLDLNFGPATEIIHATEPGGAATK